VMMMLAKQRPAVSTESATHEAITKRAAVAELVKIPTASDE
jgi:hypothetical protein